MTPTPDPALAARLLPCPLCGAVMEPCGNHAAHPSDECVLAQMIIFDDAFDDWNRRPAVQAAVAKAVDAERDRAQSLVWTLGHEIRAAMLVDEDNEQTVLDMVKATASAIRALAAVKAVQYG